METCADIEALLECGLERRAKMATKVHDHSSRSHLIVSISAAFQQHDDIDDCRSEPGTPYKHPQSIDDSVDDEFGKKILKSVL